MNKRRLATVAVVIGVAVILAASLPLSQAKANHCHPEHTQTPRTDLNKSVRTRASSFEKKTPSTRALNLERQRASARASRYNKKSVRIETSSLNMIYSREIPIAMLSIDNATKAIGSGDKKTVLAELDKALDTLVTIYKTLGTHVKPQFANNRCPIMGSPINTNIVAENLVRHYKGRKVAFCCAGCPSTWDKLTDVLKQAKLSELEH